MCKIKSGKAIHNNEDIRNLITGVILRQRKEYRKDHIVSTVLYYLDGTNLIVDKGNVSRLIDNGLDILGRNGEVTCWNGVYRTAGID